MKNTIYLCGHTGSINRGCEAIVRSTIALLESSNKYSEPILCTFNYSEDKRVNLDNICKLIEYKLIPKNSIVHYIGAILYRICRNDIFRQTIVQKSIFSNIKNEDIILQIGGDTYCYGKPFIQYATNILAKNKNIKTVLWSCSIEKIDEEMLEDLRHYSHIFPRESLTYNNLINAGLDSNKITLTVDSAFDLESNESEFSLKMINRNFVGINISPLVMGLASKTDIVIKNVENLIEYILKNTSLEIIFIPHVYDIGFQDSIPLKQLYDKFKMSKRVEIVEDYLNAKELKGIISKCRFFIGARTHATIAAYSSLVPTIVLGYSIKSRGIANDLFGYHDRYVIETQKLKTDFEILESFKMLIENEYQIKEILKSKMSKFKTLLKESIQVLDNL